MFGFGRKWWSRLTAPKVQVVRLANQARTIEFMGDCEKRENSIIDRFHQRGWEIKSPPIEIVRDGKKQMGYVVDEAGITVSFVRDIRIQTAIPVNPDQVEGDPFFELDELTVPKAGYINYAWEGVIGRCATLDDIAEGLDLGKSMKNTVIGLLVGIPIGWIFTQAMK